MFEPPHHNVGKGLMTSQGPPIHPSIFLLVRSKEFGVDTARTLVLDANINKHSEHETKALSDSGLFDMTRVSHGFIFLSFFYFVKL